MRNVDELHQPENVGSASTAPAVNAVWRLVYLRLDQ
jgi:hypothetical protein